MREIPYNLSKNLENGEDKIAQDLLDFVSDDLEKHGDEDKEIRDLDLETLTNLSKFPGLMKQIMRNINLWNKLKKDYIDPNISNKKRGNLSKLFNNSTKSNYNVENMINNDKEGINLLLNKMINEPIKSLDDGGRDIAETEVDTLCNILKDKNNCESLFKSELLNDEVINKLENLYKDLDPKIGEPLRQILSQIKEADKNKKEKNEVEEDEKKILELEKRVGNCFENHKRALMKYNSIINNKSNNEENTEISGKLNYDMEKSADDNNKTLLGKLKNPFEDKENNEGDNNRNIPGKIKNSFDVQDDKNKQNENDFLKKASSLRKMSFVSGALLYYSINQIMLKLNHL